MRQALATFVALFALLTGSWVTIPAAHAEAVPTTVSVSAPSFRPAPDGVEDTVTISATVDPSATSVTLSVDPGVVTWVLTPDAQGHVSQVWNGQGAGGPDGLAAAGSHTITAVAHMNGAPDVSAQTTVTVQIDTISASRDLLFTAKWGLAKNFSARCGKLVMPSAHHWPGSIGFNADGKCNSGRKNFAEGLFAIVPLGTFAGHTVHDYTTVQVSVYGGAAPKAYSRSSAILVPRDPHGAFLAPSKLSAHVGWHAGRVMPATDVMATDHSFAWDVVTLQHAHYDVRGFKVTIGYTYLY